MINDTSHNLINLETGKQNSVHNGRVYFRLTLTVTIKILEG